MHRIKFTAVLCAGVALVGTLAGCTSGNTNANNATTSNAPAVVVNNNSLTNTTTNTTANASANAGANASASGNANANAGAAAMRVSEVTGNMSSMTGKTVTVEGYAERAYGANAFRLDEDSNATGGVERDLLVVAREGTMPTGMSPGANARVRVTGVVRPVVVSEIEREVGRQGDVALRTVEAEFRNAPAIIAASVQVIGGGQSSTGAANQAANQNANHR